MIDVVKALRDGANRSQIEAYCEGRAKAVYQGDARSVCRVLGKYLMQVPSRDLSLAPHLMLDGYWEMWVTQAVARYVKPGMNCLNLGANVGYYTLLMADLVGEQGFVQAWEPNAPLADCLEHSLSLNGYEERVAVIRRAASSEDGVLSFSVHGDFMGSTEALLCGEDEWDESVVDFKSKCERVETHLWWVGRALDFALIDIEGAELDAWIGMNDLMKRSPRAVIALEWEQSRYRDPGRFYATLQKGGLASGQPPREIGYIGDDGEVHPVTLEELIKRRGEVMLWVAPGDRP